MTKYVTALAGTELRLVVRNRPVAFTAIVMPLVLGFAWIYSFRPQDTAGWALLGGLQLTTVLGMTVYATAAGTLVQRRDTLVLKRFRTSALSDGELLTANVLPAMIFGVVQVLIMAGVDAVAGAPLPADIGALVLTVVGGLALCGGAALATAVITTAPERTQVTTLPFSFVLVSAALLPLFVAPGALRDALIVIPGVAVSELSSLAWNGAIWTPGPFGLPAGLAGLLALIGWTAVFVGIGVRRFRWEPRG
jgi:ABC-2 type transport system permease protein